MGQTLMQIVGVERTGSHRGGTRQRYFLDDRGRQMLLNEYDGKTATIDRLALRLGVPRWMVKKWGGQLGLAQQKEPRWREEELAYLEQYLGRMSLSAIAAHLGRTKTAVQIKAKRLSVSKSADGYTLHRLMACLGADHHKIERWIARGWLKGERRGSERGAAQGGDMWFFSQEAVRKFVTWHPEEIDQRRVSWIWVVDLLAGGLGELGKE